MTSSELFKVLQQGADLNYSAYYDNVSANRFFKQGLINAAENIYLNRLTNQNAFDELNFLISTDQVYSLNNNRIYVHDLLISNVTFVTTTITVTTELAHNFIVGDSVTTSGIAGFATNNPNGTYTILTTPTTTSFTYTAASAPTGTYTANSGMVTSSKIIADYWHYFFGKAKFTVPTTYSITASTNSSPIRITLNKRSFFRSYDIVTIAGITGNTNANGTRYLKMANETQYFLYSDATLQTPVVGNGTQGGTGTISQVLYSPLKFKRSDEKGNLYGQPSEANPYYQESKQFIKILPSTIPCSEITIDYLRVPQRFIDVGDAVFDFDLWYPKQFQYAIINHTALLMAEALRDSGLMSVESQQIISNP